MRSESEGIGGRVRKWLGGEPCSLGAYHPGELEARLQPRDWMVFFLWRMHQGVARRTLQGPGLPTAVVVLTRQGGP